MKIIIHGPISARDHLGQMVGFAPDQVVEVDDNDEAAVAWAKGWADTPHGTLVEDTKKTRQAEPAREQPRVESAKDQPTRQTTSVPRTERSGK